MKKPILLVIDQEFTTQDLLKKVDTLLDRHNDRNQTLHLMAFVEDAWQELHDRVKDLWLGECVILEPRESINQVSEDVRMNLSRFIATLRKDLIELAEKKLGEKWAKRFGELWWYTGISEKNTPGNPIWWVFFRLEATLAYIQKFSYEKCLYLGDPPLAKLLKQVCKKSHIVWEDEGSRSERFLTIRLFVKRFFAFFCHLRAQMLATKVISSQGKVSGEVTWSFSLFPRSWTVREGRFQDRYLGDLPKTFEENEKKFGHLLFLYEGGDAISPKVFESRLQKLREIPVDCFYSVLEASMAKEDILKAYGNLWDAMQFFRLQKSRAFDEAFTFQELNVKSILLPLLLRFFFVSLPYFEVLEKTTVRKCQEISPQKVFLYMFEFAFGRSLMRAVEKASPRAEIIGLQHGPITPMKLLYSGDASELVPLKTLSVSNPIPKTVIVDGPAAKNILEKRGMTAERIPIMGPIRLDALWRFAAKAKRHERDRLQPLRVCVALGLHDYAPLLRLVLTAFQGEEDLKLVIKPHPKTERRAIEHVLDEFKAFPVEVFWRDDIYTCMQNVDCFLASYSSTGVEALAFDLPVILLVPNCYPDISLYSCRDYPIIKAWDANSLKAGIRRIEGQTNSEREEYLNQLKEAVYDSFAEADGLSSKRFFQYCFPKEEKEVCVE